MKNYMTQRPVYIVHCIDTEGPLHESVDATFERLREIFHLDLPASRICCGAYRLAKYRLMVSRQPSRK